MGELFIATKSLLDFSCCFLAARRWGNRRNRNVGKDGAWGLDIALVAPPKNKKKNAVVRFSAINRAPLRGFRTLRAKQTLFRPVKDMGNGQRLSVGLLSVAPPGKGLSSTISVRPSS